MKLTEAINDKEKLIDSSSTWKFADFFRYLTFRGEFVILRGPSGGGKTTLLNILGTIDAASSGEVGMCYCFRLFFGFISRTSWGDY